MRSPYRAFRLLILPVIQCVIGRYAAYRPDGGGGKEVSRLLGNLEGVNTCCGGVRTCRRRYAKARLLSGERQLGITLGLRCGQSVSFLQLCMQATYSIRTSQ